MNLAPDVLALLTAQVTRERYAQAAYTALAAWANQRAHPGLEAWAMDAAAEEGAHALRLIAWLNVRDAATLEALPAPPADFGDYAGALTTALALEREVTAALTTIGRAAVAGGDFATLALLQDLLTEQAHAEHELATYLQRVGRGAPIDLLDAELFEEAAG